MRAIAKTPAVTEQVAGHLKRQIRDGRWAPGSRISSENQLTKELGVSRASVRSGIKQLEAIGILESVQGKGTFVRAIPPKDLTKALNRLYKTNKDMQDLMEYRMILESESCRLAADRMNESDIRELEELYRRMTDEYLKKDQRTGDIFAECDYGFHKRICLATNNRLVAESLAKIGEETERIQARFNTDYLSERAVYYHGKILEALKERNGSRAASEMRKHLTLVIKEYDRLLREAEEAGQDDN